MACLVVDGWDPMRRTEIPFFEDALKTAKEFMKAKPNFTQTNDEKAAISKALLCQAPARVSVEVVFILR